MAALDETTPFEALRRDILSGVFAPGDPLRLAGLSERYNVSATPLREALSRLEERRLVVAQRNKGWQVAPVSLEQLEDLAAARLTLETAMTEEAIAQGDLDWESGIVAAFHRLSRLDGQDMPRDRARRLRWRAAHDAFHRALLASVRSARLRQLYADLIEEMQRHHDLAIYAPGQRTLSEETLHAVHSLQSHRVLQDAFLARDASRAKALMRAHVCHTLEVYRSATSGETRGPARATRDNREE